MSSLLNFTWISVQHQYLCATLRELEQTMFHFSTVSSPGDLTVENAPRLLTVCDVVKDRYCIQTFIKHNPVDFQNVFVLSHYYNEIKLAVWRRLSSWTSCRRLNNLPKLLELEGSASSCQACKRLLSRLGLQSETSSSTTRSVHNFFLPLQRADTLSWRVLTDILTYLLTVEIWHVRVLDERIGMSFLLLFVLETFLFVLFLELQSFVFWSPSLVFVLSWSEDFYVF